MNTTRLLVDSHILVWLVFEPARLSQATVDLLEHADEVFVSSVSLWELTIKHSYGKLKYPPKLIMDGVVAAGLTRLPIRDSHLVAYASVELPHKDPFDTLLAAQAQAEDVPLVTADKLLIDSNCLTIDARA